MAIPLGFNQCKIGVVICCILADAGAGPHSAVWLKTSRERKSGEFIETPHVAGSPGEHRRDPGKKPIRESLGGGQNVSHVVPIETKMTSDSSTASREYT